MSVHPSLSDMTPLLPSQEKASGNFSPADSGVWGQRRRPAGWTSVFSLHRPSLFSWDAPQSCLGTPPPLSVCAVLGFTRPPRPTQVRGCITYSHNSGAGVGGTPSQGKLTRPRETSAAGNAWERHCSLTKARR